MRKNRFANNIAYFTADLSIKQSLNTYLDLRGIFLEGSESIIGGGLIYIFDSIEGNDYIVDFNEVEDTIGIFDNLKTSQDYGVIHFDLQGTLHLNFQSTIFD